jgi:hypothetical protein
MRGAFSIKGTMSNFVVIIGTCEYLQSIHHAIALAMLRFRSPHFRVENKWLVESFKNRLISEQLEALVVLPIMNHYKCTDYEILYSLVREHCPEMDCDFYEAVREIRRAVWIDSANVSLVGDDLVLIAHTRR